MSEHLNDNWSTASRADWPFRRLGGNVDDRLEKRLGRMKPNSRFAEDIDRKRPRTSLVPAPLNSECFALSWWVRVERNSIQIDEVGVYGCRVGEENEGASGRVRNNAGLGYTCSLHPVLSHNRVALRGEQSEKLALSRLIKPHTTTQKLTDLLQTGSGPRDLVFCRTSGGGEG